MPSFRGKPACECLVQWLPAYERELLRLGLLKRSLDIYQLIGTYVKSAGTHGGGGSADLGQFTTEQLRVARNMGGAGWHRTPAQGFTHHSHIVLKGCPHAAQGAKQQVVSLDLGRNGLATNGPDDGPRQGVQWPLRTWKQGIEWAGAELIKAEKAAEKAEENEMNATEKAQLEEIWQSVRPGHKGKHHEGSVLADLGRVESKLDALAKAVADLKAGK